jgi:hypothetical protein
MFVSVSRLHPCWLVVCVAVLSGCASNGQQTARVMEGDGADQPAMSAAGEMARRLLPNTDNGLEVRKWVITPEQAARLLPALAPISSDDPQLASHTATLERNGFRLVRVPLDQVDDVLAEIGGATVDVSEWHGQALDWRPLLERSVGRSPRALAIDGRVRRFDRGNFSLMIRSWTVQMETGPFVHLEAVPRHQWCHGTNLRKLLSENEEPSGETFATMALDLLLESTWAYVLFGASPQAPWPNRADSTQDGVRGATWSGQPRKLVGPSVDDEPDIGSVQTIGEFQLTTDRRPAMRTVFIFMPRIAPAETVAGDAAAGSSHD